jgi:hypothetical protein
MRRPISPLLFLGGHCQLLQHSKGLVMKQISASVNERTTSLALDPYEEQYQQYFNNYNSNTEATKDMHPSNQHSLQVPVTTFVGSSSSNASKVDDPYESQYQQYYYETTATKDIPVNMAEETTKMKEFLEQEERELVVTQEMEEEFLKMVSNEVQYKKLLGKNPYALTDIDIPVIMQRFLDNLEDEQQKNNGKVKGQSKLKGEKTPKEERKTIVVLGTYNAGYFK